MKTYVSYIIQTPGGHTHGFEILDIQSPPYTYSSDPPVSEVLKWAEKKQKDLPQNQKIEVVGMYKI